MSDDIKLPIQHEIVSIEDFMNVSIEDFMNVATDENLDMLIGNFYGMTLQYLEIRKKCPEVKFKSFKWTDDDIIEIRRPEVFKINLEEPNK